MKGVSMGLIIGLYMDCRVNQWVFIPEQKGRTGALLRFYGIFGVIIGASGNTWDISVNRFIMSFI